MPSQEDVLQYNTLHAVFYTVSGKKGTNSILGITSSNTDRFSKFFHLYNLLEICNKASLNILSHLKRVGSTEQWSRRRRHQRRRRRFRSEETDGSGRHWVEGTTAVWWPGRGNGADRRGAETIVRLMDWRYPDVIRILFRLRPVTIYIVGMDRRMRGTLSRASRLIDPSSNRHSTNSSTPCPEKK